MPGSFGYLTASRINPVTTVEQAKVPNWDMGQRVPTAAQTPYFKMGSFAYPAAYTIGSLGARVLAAPSLFWMQCFATKSWHPVGERFMLSFRLDGHNLPHKNPNIAAPKTTYNLNNPGALGRFTGVGNFSNFESHTPRVLSAFHSDFDFVMECGKVIWERR